MRPLGTDFALFYYLHIYRVLETLGIPNRKAAPTLGHVQGAEHQTSSTYRGVRDLPLNRSWVGKARML